MKEVIEIVNDLYYDFFNDGEMKLTTAQIKLLKSNDWVFANITKTNKSLLFYHIIDITKDCGRVPENPYYIIDDDDYFYPHANKEIRMILYQVLEAMMNNVFAGGPIIDLE